MFSIYSLMEPARINKSSKWSLLVHFFLFLQPSHSSNTSKRWVFILPWFSLTEGTALFLSFSNSSKLNALWKELGFLCLGMFSPASFPFHPTSSTPPFCLSFSSSLILPHHTIFSIYRSVFNLEFKAIRSFLKNQIKLFQDHLHDLGRLLPDSWAQSTGFGC